LKTDWKDDIFTRRKLRLEQNSDGTVTPVDETVYTQQGDAFGAKELNEIGEEINEVKKSVSDGKALVAASITAKRVATAATDTFAQFKANIDKIRLGSGNALKSHVLAGKTFTNDDGVEYTGEMPERAGEQIPASQVTKSGNAIVMKSSRNGHINENTAISADQSAVASAAGVNGAVIRAGYNVLGVAGQIQSLAGADITPQTYAQTIAAAGKYGAANHNIRGVPLPPANVIKRGYRYWIGSNYVDGTYVYSDITGYYYQAPNEMTGVTGGWNWVLPSDQKPNPGTLSRQPGYMEIKMNPGPWSGGGSSDSNTIAAFVCTAYKINITNIRTIYLPFINGSYGGYSTYLGISNGVPNSKNWSDFVIAVNNNPVAGKQLVLDVSNITGSYYLVIKVTAFYGSSSGMHVNNTRFSEIRYETMER